MLLSSASQGKLAPTQVPAHSGDKTAAPAVAAVSTDGPTAAVPSLEQLLQVSGPTGSVLLEMSLLLIRNH